jgi:hypothetical protein
VVGALKRGKGLECVWGGGGGEEIIWTCKEFGSIGLSYLCGERESATEQPVKPSIQRDDDKQTIQTLVITAGRRKKES